MNSFYPGVLNTGRRKYAHPALSGRLPTPWLPTRASHPQVGNKGPKSVVLSLRRKAGKKMSRSNRAQSGDGSQNQDDWETQEPPSRVTSGNNLSAPSQSGSNPWNERSPSPDDRRFQPEAFNSPSGGVDVPEDNVWARSEETSDEEGIEVGKSVSLYVFVTDNQVQSTYYPHPERQRSASIGRQTGWNE